MPILKRPNGALERAARPNLKSRPMTKANDTNTLKTAPSRRAMLTGSGALLAGVTGFLAAAAAPGAVQAAESPDAELLAATSKYFEAERLLDEKYGEEDIEYEDPLLTEISDSVETIINARASTLEGHRARARAITFYHPSLIDTQRAQGGDEAMIAALLRDLVGEVAA